ncbi:MAG: DVUA0089 family protein [Phycisphaerales bacterium]|nr:DVUA0089 family protein [Phycisphaerales bacterium]
MLNFKSLLLVAAATLFVGSAAHAGPRDSVTVTNINTDIGGTCGGFAGSGTIPITAAYTVQYIVISGTFTRIAAGTCESEATIRIFDAAGTQVIAIAPFSTCTGQTTVSNLVVKLPRPIAVTASANWAFVTAEIYNDTNAAVDGRWDSLSITLDDGPPFWLFVADCGPVRAPGFSLANQNINANSVRWYKFSLPLPAGDLGFFGQRFLDIDTEGSPTGDMEIAVFDADGRLIASDDDSGSGRQARLTFGAGAARPPFGNGLPYDNGNGSLEAGTYYIAIAPFDVSFGATSWANTPTFATAATARLNIRTNIEFSPFCKGDFNQDGNYNTLDILDFLNTWFAGCP